MRQKFLGILALCLCFLTAQAQENAAVQLLQRAGDNYQKNGGVDAAFHLVVLEPGGAQADDFDGTIQLKGNKFKLDVPDEMITWFDGRNQWLYLIQAEEVNLSNPDEEELLMINPVNVFLLYRHGYDCRLESDRNYQGKAVRAVTLRPQDKQSDLSDILVYFDKVSLQPCHIRITNKDRSGSIIQITRYKPGQSYPDSKFVFQQKDYPEAEVIDLR